MDQELWNVPSNLLLRIEIQVLKKVALKRLDRIRILLSDSHGNVARSHRNGGVFVQEKFVNLVELRIILK